MYSSKNVRLASIVSHAKHGKSCLIQSAVGSSSKGKVICVALSIPEESLKRFKGERVGNEFFLSLVDTDTEVSSCFADGVLVVVDCVEGLRLQTETLLRQALEESIRPVLTVNKMDRLFLELQLDGEEAYQTIQRSIENANAIIGNYKDSLLGDVEVYPEKGTVAFSSGLHGWSFTLTKFAKMYASKFGVDEAKMTERLWGDKFFDGATKKWTTRNTGSATCKRGFVQFCYEPIKQIINTCMNDQKDNLWFMLDKLHVTMKTDEKDLKGNALMKRVMQTWLPASSSLLEMMIFQLPSPREAQKYRVENLYEGPLDDMYANAIRNCDPEGPLMLYVSRMIPAVDKGKFFTFGRVFSGIVSSGLKVRIMGPNYVPGEKKDLYVKSLERSAIWMGKKQENVEEVACGNIVAMVGLDQFIVKNATLTNEKEVDAQPAIKFSVVPVASDLPKLVEGMNHLAKHVPLVLCSIEESGGVLLAKSLCLNCETHVNTFATPGDLKQHSIWAHDGNKFFCHCGNNFFNEKALEQHQNEAHSTKLRHKKCPKKVH